MAHGHFEGKDERDPAIRAAVHAGSARRERLVSGAACRAAGARRRALGAARRRSRPRAGRVGALASGVCERASSPSRSRRGQARDGPGPGIRALARGDDRRAAVRLPRGCRLAEDRSDADAGTAASDASAGGDSESDRRPADAVAIGRERVHAAFVAGEELERRRVPADPQTAFNPAAADAVLAAQGLVSAEELAVGRGEDGEPGAHWTPVLGPCAAHPRVVDEGRLRGVQEFRVPFEIRDPEV